MGNPFELASSFTPGGDQPAAIKTLIDGIYDGEAAMTLLGVTGSGKTYNMSNVNQELQRPT